MLLTGARSILNRPTSLARIAQRSYRSHEVNIFYPPSSGVAPLIESQPMPRSRDCKQKNTVEPMMATSKTSKVRTRPNMHVAPMNQRYPEQVRWGCNRPFGSGFFGSNVDEDDPPLVGESNHCPTAYFPKVCTEGKSRCTDRVCFDVLGP